MYNTHTFRHLSDIHYRKLLVSLIDYKVYKYAGRLTLKQDITN